MVRVPMFGRLGALLRAAARAALGEQRDAIMSRRSPGPNGSAAPSGKSSSAGSGADQGASGAGADPVGLQLPVHL